MKSFFPIFAVLVFGFFACKETPKTPVAETETPPMQPAVVETPPSPTSCYKLMVEQDITAIQLTVNGDSVQGFYAWEPHMEHGGRGFLEGKVQADGIFVLTFNYMIEGSIQSEELLFKKSGDDLVQARGELVEAKGGKLVLKDKTKLNWKDTYKKTDCTDVSESIGRATEVSDLIKAQKK